MKFFQTGFDKKNDFSQFIWLQWFHGYSNLSMLIKKYSIHCTYSCLQIKTGITVQEPTWYKFSWRFS